MFAFITDLFHRLSNVETLLSIGQVFLFIILGFILLKIILIILSRTLSKTASPQMVMLIMKIVKYTGIIVIAFAVLQELGINIGIILGTAGVAGIALGFASQTSLSNFISGLFLIAEKPFEIGDVININNFKGTVISIDLLSVKISTFNNKYVRIPNELIIKSELMNITRFPIRRLDFNVSVAYKEDLEKVQAVLFSIAKENRYCLDNPEPVFIIKEFASSGIDILFGAWFLKTEYINTQNYMMIEIKKRFEEENIEIPFPHLSLYAGSNTASIPIEINEKKKDI
ncbi:MAG: mechanosensitive ion channel family protein [Spirochaetales bacterium]|nr:mechanosensitive ion channel family protein [Spirochaetales bacterium]